MIQGWRNGNASYLSQLVVPRPKNRYSLVLGGSLKMSIQYFRACFLAEFKVKIDIFAS